MSSPLQDPRLRRRLSWVLGLAIVLLAAAQATATGLAGALVPLLVRPALALDRWGLLEHSPVGVQATGLLLGGAFWGLLEIAERRPAVARGLLTLALLPLAAGLWLLALGMAPAFVVGLILGPALALALRPAAHHPVDPVESSRPRADRLARGALALGAGLVAANALTLLTSGPGDAQTPLELLVWLDGLPAPRLWMGAAAASLLWLDAPRRRWAWFAAAAAWAGATLLSMALPPPGLDDPLRNALLAAPDVVPAALLLAALLLVDGPPHRARLAALLLCPLLALVHVATRDVLGCEAVRADPRLSVLSERPGGFAVQSVPGGAFASFRDDGVIERLGLDGSRVVVDPTDLDLDAWAGQRSSGLPGRTAHPEELGLDPQGRVHAFVELPGDVPAMALMLLDQASGDVLEARQGEGGCFVSSWVQAGDVALAGCEWNGRLLRFAPERGLWFDPLSTGGGELEELVRDPTDGSLLTVGLWSSPWLRRLDPVDGAVIARARVWTFAWGLTLDDEQRPWVAGFHSRRLRRFDRSLSPQRRADVGYSVRSLAWSGPQAAVLAASGYDGHLYAVDAELRSHRLRLGGWLRDVDVEPDGRHALVVGMCGVLRVDLDRWLGAP